MLYTARREFPSRLTQREEFLPYLRLMALPTAYFRVDRLSISNSGRASSTVLRVKSDDAMLDDLVDLLRWFPARQRARGGEKKDTSRLVSSVWVVDRKIWLRSSLQAVPHKLVSVSILAWLLLNGF